MEKKRRRRTRLIRKGRLHRGNCGDEKKNAPHLHRQYTTTTTATATTTTTTIIVKIQSVRRRRRQSVIDIIIMTIYRYTRDVKNRRVRASGEKSTRVSRRLDRLRARALIESVAAEAVAAEKNIIK